MTRYHEAPTGALRFASYLQDRAAVPRTISAYDVMFIVLVAANALFHYWRHADGSGAPGPE